MPIVEVKPLPAKKWHKKEGKDSFTLAKSMEVLYDSATGGYATGLTEEERVKYEGLMKVPLDNVFNREKPHEYWSTTAAAIKLENRTNFFNTDIPAEFIKVKNMYASPQVANSLKEWEDGLWPSATHYIFDEEQEVEVKASKIERKQKINYYLYQMDLEQKQNIILCINGKNFKGRSPKFVDVELEALIETEMDNLVKFIKMDKKDLFNRAVVVEAHSKGILTKEGPAYYYMGEMFASNFEDAIAKFASPDQQQFKATIIEKLNA